MTICVQLLRKRGKVLIFMEEILKILDKEKSNISRAKIAQMLGTEEQEVADAIEKLEKENVIVG